MIARTPKQVGIRFLRKHGVICTAGPCGFEMSFHEHEQEWERYPEEPERVTWHEVAHAVTSLLVGVSIQRLCLHVDVGAFPVSQAPKKTLGTRRHPQITSRCNKCGRLAVRLQKLGHHADIDRMILVTKRLSCNDTSGLPRRLARS